MKQMGSIPTTRTTIKQGTAVFCLKIFNAILKVHKFDKISSYNTVHLEFAT